MSARVCLGRHCFDSALFFYLYSSSSAFPSTGSNTAEPPSIEPIIEPSRWTMRLLKFHLGAESCQKACNVLAAAIAKLVTNKGSTPNNGSHCNLEEESLSAWLQ